MDIDQLISSRSVYSVFQPVISVSRGRTIFEEALSRGLGEDGKPVSPLSMIEQARSVGRLRELDHMMIESALRIWAAREFPGVISVNVDTSCIDDSTLDLFLRLVNELNLDAKNIIIEICENHIQSSEILSCFVKSCRAAGFLIAIDDLGKEYSNLDRIVSLAPDIIKLDRDLVENVHEDAHKRALVRSMVTFGEECGALVVAEGVECWEEVFALVEQGIDMFQGFYFARPAAIPFSDSSWLPKANVVQQSFRVFHTNLTRKNHEFRELIEQICLKACNNFSKGRARCFDEILARYVKRVNQVECLFVLDGSGVQESVAHFSPSAVNKRPSLFYPPGPGGDHSLRSYFLNLPRNGSYLSDPYISQATGNLCRTFSCWFEDAKARRHVLCVDLSERSVLFAIHAQQFHFEPNYHI